MKEVNNKDVIVSTVLTFLAGAIPVLLEGIQHLDKATLTVSFVTGLVLAAVRAGIKYLLEDYLFKIKAKIKTKVIK